MSPESPYRVLLVDDDENFLAATARAFHRRWPIVTAPGGEAGLQAIDRDGPFALVIADYSMPGMDGIRFLTLAREKAPDAVPIILTGTGDLSTAVEAVNEGRVFRFLTKPCPTETLGRAIEAGIHQFRLIETEKEARLQEVRIAAEIQKTLLLEPPPAGIKGAEIASLTIPSAGADGDFIDFFDHSPTCLDIVVGDVMGKGLSAALVGAGAKARFSRILTRLLADPQARSSAVDGLPSPQRIMRRLQDELGNRLLDLQRFITLCYARFDFSARRLTFVDAGHMPTLFVSAADGVCRELKGLGCPLGFPFLAPYEEVVVGFQPGDVFFLFSDGLLEGTTAIREAFGMPRIAATLARYRQENAAAILDRLMGEFRAFVARDAFQDDVTCVVVKIGAA